jgi:PAS domain S-box-containing protein
MDWSGDGVSGDTAHPDRESLARLREIEAQRVIAADGRAPGAPPVSFHDILNSITDGVILADRDGRFLQFNPAAERILGLGPAGVPPSEWTATYGCFLEDTVTPFPTDELPLLRALRGETVYDCPMFIRNTRTPQGVWLRINSRPIRDDAGTVTGGIIVFRDVTAKREQVEREQMHSAVIEQTADSVIITDREGVIEYANPAAAAITGFSVRELTGRTPRLFSSGLHDDEFYTKLWTTLSEGRVYRGTIVDRTKNGDVYYCGQTITPIRDAGGRIVRFVSVGKDVTELRKAVERDSRLLLARSVQQRLYPAAPLRSCGFDIAGSAFPAHETGGDYFDFIPLPEGGLAVAVGDVSGHGFDTALVMAETRAYLRSSAQTQSDPGEMLSLVNRVLIGDIGETHFVTLLVSCLDAPSRTLRYASAGHVTGHLLDMSGAIKSELTSTGPPLGIFHDAHFDTVTPPPLQEGDLVVLLTDGVTETEGPDGAAFGEQRALDVVREHCHEPSAKIVNRLYRAIRDFARQRPQVDGLTAVVCRLDHCAPA